MKGDGTHLEHTIDLLYTNQRKVVHSEVFLMNIFLMRKASDKPSSGADQCNYCILHCIMFCVVHS